MRTKTKTTRAAATPTPAPAVDARVQAARDEVLAQREVLAQWQGRKAEAAVELGRLEDRAGVAILDNPDAEDEVDETISRLRRRIRNADKAIEAQRPRIMIAESAYLAAEADVIEPRLQEINERLAKHEAVTVRLLKELEEHEGVFVPERRLINAMISPGVVWVGDRPTVTKLEKSNQIRREQRTVLFQVEYLRKMAAGEDPRPLVYQWPDSHGPAPVPECVQGPDALVPTDEYLEAVDRARGVVEELERLQARLPHEIATKRYEDSRTGLADAPPSPGVLRLEQRLEELPAEIAAARAHLDQLTTSTGEVAAV